MFDDFESDIWKSSNILSDDSLTNILFYSDRFAQILCNEFPNPTAKTRTWLYISSSLFIHYSDSPFDIRASSPGLGYILIYVGQSYSSVGHQFTWVEQTKKTLSFSHVRQNLQWFPVYNGQFHEWKIDALERQNSRAKRLFSQWLANEMTTKNIIEHIGIEGTGLSSEIPHTRTNS
jgi:hypothetical protein